MTKDIKMLLDLKENISVDDSRLLLEIDRCIECLYILDELPEELENYDENFNFYYKEFMKRLESIKNHI